MAVVGEIRIAAYEAGGFISADSVYAPTLRGLGADGNGHVLVAVLPARGDPAGDSLQAGDGDPADDGDQAGAGDHTGSGPDRAQQVVGTVMLQTWPHTGQVVAGPDEAEIRALAVRPEIQGMGIGRTLLRHALQRAAELGVRHLVLCTEPAMRVAHRLYEQAGFVRLPERDWSPAPGITLLVYGLNLGALSEPNSAQPVAVTAGPSGRPAHPPLAGP